MFVAFFGPLRIGILHHAFNEWCYIGDSRFNDQLLRASATLTHAFSQCYPVMGISVRMPEVKATNLHTLSQVSGTHVPMEKTDVVPISN